jgi:hypothetical protein
MTLLPWIVFWAAFAGAGIGYYVGRQDMERAKRREWMAGYNAAMAARGLLVHLTHRAVADSLATSGSVKPPEYLQ